MWTSEDKGLGEARDKKGLAKGCYLGELKFYQNIFTLLQIIVLLSNKILLSSAIIDFLSSSMEPFCVFY